MGEILVTLQTSVHSNNITPKSQYHQVHDKNINQDDDFTCMCVRKWMCVNDNSKRQPTTTTTSRIIYNNQRQQKKSVIP